MSSDRYSPFKNYTILYAEDSESTRGIYTGILNNLFSQTYSVNDGSQAWEHFHHDHPDIILTDIEMPHLDGLTLVQKIRDIDKNIPIIVMTSHNESEKLLQAIPLGLTAYLTKPVHIEALEKALFQALHRLEQAEGEQRKIVINADLCWDTQTQRLIKHGNEVLLSKNEKLLFSLLVSQKYRTYSYDEIIECMYEQGYDNEISMDGLKSIVKRLRKKLELPLIENVYGIGYRLVI